MTERTLPTILKVETVAKVVFMRFKRLIYVFPMAKNEPLSV